MDRPKVLQETELGANPILKGCKGLTCPALH